MLTSRPTQGSLRLARNVVPVRTGGVSTRPGAVQVVAGSVTAVVPWGERLVLAQDGRILVWDGVLHDVGLAGPVLDGARFQALTENAQREDRCYVADGINPLWYLAEDGLGGYARRTFANQETDPLSGVPVALPIARAVAVWAQRLWIATGGNFIQHCENDQPHRWNPLWTIEFQGAGADQVVAMEPAGDNLLVGLTRAVWVLTGKSQFDFQRRAVYAGGVAGTRAAASDGEFPYWLGRGGVRGGETSATLSGPIEDWFAGGVLGNLAIDRQRRWLLIALNGRLLVAHLDRGSWGEVAPCEVLGVWASVEASGWFGADGVWRFTDAQQDVRADGTRASVVFLAETWPDVPNPQGGGRAVLVRLFATLRGAADALVQYTPVVDGLDHVEGGVSWTAAAVQPAWTSTQAQYDALPPVVREAIPRLTGTAFAHQLAGMGAVELVEPLRPQYRSVGGGS